MAPRDPGRPLQCPLPLLGSVATFTTLTLEGHGRDWALEPTSWAIAAGGIVMAVGAGLVAAGLHGIGSSLAGGLVFVSAGLAFLWIGGFVRAFFASGARFDTLHRRISLRRPVLEGGWWRSKEVATVKFEEVHALELRRKVVIVDDTIRRNVALDLLVKGRGRVELLSHIDEDRARADAHTLGRLLGAPLRELHRPRPQAGT